MVQEREVLVIFYCSVTGENDELLGVDETPITEINWIAIDSTENKVRTVLSHSSLSRAGTLLGQYEYRERGVMEDYVKILSGEVEIFRFF